MTVAKIVFASMTGNTEEIADIVADKFRDLGVEVDVDECTTVDAEDFLEADIAVVAISTKIWLALISKANFTVW